MLKHKTKCILILALFLCLISTLVFATDTANPISEQENQINPIADNEGNTTNTNNFHEGDFYLAGSDITLDQTVLGNVFLYGNNVTINAQVDGDIFVFGNNVNLDAASAQNNIFVFANTATFNGYTYNLYAFCNSITIKYESYIERDLTVGAEKLDLQGIVGRNANISVNRFTLGSNDNKETLIYGNLNYNSFKDTSIDTNALQGFVQGTVTYNPQEKVDVQFMPQIIFGAKLFSLAQGLIVAAIIWLFISFLAPKALSKLSNTVKAKWLPSIGLGLLAIILIPVLCVLVMLTVIGIPISLFLLACYILLLLISTPIVSIAVGKMIAQITHQDKRYMEFLFTILVVLGLWILKLIPAIGWIISILTGIFALGIIILSIVSKKDKTKNDVLSTENNEKI